MGGRAGCLHARIAGRFTRAEPRRRALAYLRGLLGNVGRKNGWQLAEHAGERTPDRMQRLLATAGWDPDGVRDDLRGYVVEQLGDPGAVLVVDETGFFEEGHHLGRGAAPVLRHGRQGRQLPARRLPGLRQRKGAGGGRPGAVPARGLDRGSAALPGRQGPRGVGFRTKPQLAQLMLERALAAGVPAAWVAADEVYGGSPALRGWLEGRGVGHVLAVKRTELLEVSRPNGVVRASAEQLAAAVPATQWVACSAGHGAKGRRLDDWVRVELAAPAMAGMARWRLVRRSRSDRGAGLLRLLRAGRHAAGRPGRGGGDPLGGGGGFPAGQGPGRPGPLRGPQVAGLVPARHLGAAGLRVLGGHPRPGGQRRGAKGDAAA
jgi:hypothetical protein